MSNWDSSLKIFVNENSQGFCVVDSQRMFAMQKDFLADTPTYKRLVKEGFDKGLEVLRQAVVDVVQERFPELAALAQKQIEGIEDTTLLLRLNVKMSTAQTMQEAALSLLSLDNNAKKN